MAPSGQAPLLIEIGCEEIPARMVRSAAKDLAARVSRILDQAGLSHGSHRAWGGSRRLAVRVEQVQPHQPDREETVLGPPAQVAFGQDGSPSKAATGFARKQGIDPGELVVLDTERGRYAGFTRRVEGMTVGLVLAAELQESVAGMFFPKTMRWADGRWRWVRPVHWLLALHGESVLPIELFGVRATGSSHGHRFLARGPVEVGHPDRYAQALARAHVLVDPDERRRRLSELLSEATRRLEAVVVEDPELLEELVDLVEWPGVVTGRFDGDFLDLPRELLITTLRHHQKCFSVQDARGRLLPAFLALANTDRDPRGHIRRGNEWVVSGRLEDARFFWREDRKTSLAELSGRLHGVVFHRKVGSYAEKAERVAELAGELAAALGLDAATVEHCRQAAGLCKNDLVTGTVGEFPELQGRVGGLLLLAEGAAEPVARGVYEHYRPSGPDDAPPQTTVGRVVSIADKLDSVSRLIAAGERPSGSRDPLGLRRAGNGIIRVLWDSGWPTTLGELARLVEPAGGSTLGFLRERLETVLRELGYTVKEILAVTRPRVDASEANGWPLADIRARLEAIKRVRDREDYRHLVKLTQRVDNILTKNAATIDEVVGRAEKPYTEAQPAAVELAALVDQTTPLVQSRSNRKCYDEVVQILSEFIDPVERFFTDCLVIDPNHPEATRRRYDLLVELNRLLTKYFDIRELAGEAEGKPQ